MYLADNSLESIAACSFYFFFFSAICLNRRSSTTTYDSQLSFSDEEETQETRGQLDTRITYVSGVK